MTDYRPILNTCLGSLGGIPVRELLGALESARDRGSIRAECRSAGGRVRPLAGCLWPQAGYDEWFLMAAIYPRAAQEGLLTYLDGQRLSPILLALDIEYVTWANPNATVINPGLGSDWPEGTRPKTRKVKAGDEHGPLMQIGECPEIETAGLTVRHPLPAHAWRELVVGSYVDPWVVAHFNPSYLVWRGHRWLAYRTECQPLYKWGRVSLARLSEDGGVIEGSNQVLPLATSFGEWAAEDPRLFLFRGRMFVYYTDHWTGGLAEILEDGSAVDAPLFPAESVETVMLRSRHDKN